MQLLICTNGTAAGQAAIEYGLWLAEALKVPVVVLGIAESLGSREAIDHLVEETRRSAVQRNLRCSTNVVGGAAEEAIPRVAAQGDFLTLVGPMGRSIWRRIWRGSTFRGLLKLLESPLLYVPKARLKLRRILLCTGGLHYAEGVIRMMERIALATGARVTLLHVTEPASLDYPVVEELKAAGEQLLQSATPQARYLQQAIGQFEQSGIPLELKTRHGYVVHEILAEIHEADYDMVGLGSSYGPKAMRRLFTPSVTAEVVEAVDLPILVARYGPETDHLPEPGQ